MQGSDRALARHVLGWLLGSQSVSLSSVLPHTTTEALSQGEGVESLSSLQTGVRKATPQTWEVGCNALI